MTQETAPDTPAEGARAQDADVADRVESGTADGRARGATEESAPTAAGRSGTRRRRAPKQDPLLVGDVATARAAVEEVAEPSQIGSGHRVVAEEDRLVVHLFECTLPGYRGWNWFASLARAPRSRAVTVCEVGLLPGEDALTAPEWVPWAERVSPEEKAQEEQARTEDGGEDPAPGALDAVDSAADDDAVAAGPGGDEEPPRDGDRL